MVRRRVAPIVVDVEKINVDVPTRNSQRVSDRLRYEARCIYVCHPDGVTVEELSKDPRFKSVAYETMQSWCKQDGWVEERKRALEGFSDKLKSQLQKALYNRIAQVRIEQLETVQKLKNDLVDKSINAEVKSAEGAAKVAIDLMKHELELSVTIGRELLPNASGPAIEPRNDLSEDEVLEAARVVLRNRRKSADPQQPQLQEKNP
jgi:hypothetical protein